MGFRPPAGRPAMSGWARRPGLSGGVRRRAPDRSPGASRAGREVTPGAPEPGGPAGPGTRLPPRAGRRVSRLAAAVVAVAVLAASALLLLDVLLWPSLRTLAQAELQNLATEVLYEAVGREVAESGADYYSLFRVEMDQDGRVTFLQPNTPAINAFAARVTAAIKETIGTVGGRTVYIPLGRALGSRLLGGVGPKIAVTIHPLMVQSVNIRDIFESAGINQTRHRIYLTVTLDARMAVPFIESEVSVSNEFPVAEAVIVGPVPDTYLGGGLLPYFPRLPGEGGE